MKKIAALILIPVLMLSFCACGGGKTEEPIPQPTVTLNVVTSYGSEDGNRQNFEAAVREYEESTGVTVIDNSDTSNEEWKARVLTDFETGSEPDVLSFFTNADAEPFIKAGKVVSIRQIREEYPDFASNMDDTKLPVASDGLSYAVPIMGCWEYLYVNRSVLSQCGVELPGRDYTWDQFVQDCTVIRDCGFTPIACSLTEVPHYWFEFAVMNNGTADDHLNIPTLDEQHRLVNDSTAAKWIAGLEDIKELYQLGFFPENTLTAADSETVAQFGDGKAAFLLDGSWKVGYFSKNYADRLDNFAVCYVPAKGERRATETIGGITTGFFITAKAWNDPQKRDVAVKFVSALTSDRVVQSFVTTEVTALKRDVRSGELNPLQSNAAETMSGSERMVAAVQDAISGEARGSLFANIQNVVLGKMTAHDAVEAAMQLN